VIGENHIEAGILATANLKELGVPTIIARATSKLHARVLERVGADRVIQPEREMGEQVARVLASPTVLDYVDLGEDEALIEARVPEQWAGKSLAELSLSRNLGLTVVAHKPQGGAGTLPTGDTVLKDGDLIVVGGTKKVLDASPLSGPPPGKR
jgi:trk system potassium uptake protein TrkA